MNCLLKKVINMSLIIADDFTGKYEVHISQFTADKLQEYIDRYETSILNKLLGVELYNLFIADIVLPVPSPIYEKIFLPFIEQTDRGDILESKGMKDLLTGMIYFYYVRDQYTQMSTLGAVKNKGENSESTTFVMSGLNARWNEAVETYNSIQHYVELNKSVDYPTFKGLREFPALSM